MIDKNYFGEGKNIEFKTINEQVRDFA